MNLCRIDLDKLCKDASSSSLGPVDLYRQTLHEDVQAFCIDAGMKHIYIVDELDKHERKLNLTGRQVAVTKNQAVDQSRCCFSANRYFLVCSMFSHIANKEITLTLYTSTLKKVDVTKLDSTETFTASRMMLVATGSLKSPLFMAFDSSFKVFAYYLFRNRICPVAYDQNMGISDSPDKFNSMIINQEYQQPKYMVLHMQPSNIEKSGKLTIFMSGFTKTIRRFTICTLVAKLTINI